MRYLSVVQQCVQHFAVKIEEDGVAFIPRGSARWITAEHVDDVEEIAALDVGQRIVYVTDCSLFSIRQR